MSDPKSMARRLRADLAQRGVELSHSEALEIVAHQYGVRDWNTLAAQPPEPVDPTVDRPALGAAVPILRTFDRAKAMEFYVDFLGFTLDWEHGGHADHSPLYAQVSRGATRLHLSEHYGDASPGGAALMPVADIEALHAELHDRDYDYARPGIREEDWGRVLVVVDPFNNRLVFHQPVTDDTVPRSTEAAGPIEHGYHLACSPAEAFSAFTRRIGDWWHTAYGPEGMTSIHVAPAVGGPAMMRLADGTAYQWGTVTAWEQPEHYAQTFTLAQDPEHPSTLEAWFAPHPDGGCAFRFAHGGWTAGNLAGRARFTEWPILLDRFAAVAEGRPVPEVPDHVLQGGG
ncbi:glyoxalase superfamily protein [Nocardioides cynanchi]|uniref:glyoxalase superfamily protein n=1 Tax=Nocardioides cynanchi TaxID=2558918 RepID=UPI00178558C9|nr:glyoxalase superfamily protein [Nocardioides cynanchi]